jgi:hypothetical protein
MFPTKKESFGLGSITLTRCFSGGTGGTSAIESLDYEFKQRKAWFNEEFSKLIDEGKQAKLQWVQNPS